MIRFIIRYLTKNNKISWHDWSSIFKWFSKIPVFIFYTSIVFLISYLYKNVYMRKQYLVSFFSEYRNVDKLDRKSVKKLIVIPLKNNFRQNVILGVDIVKLFYWNKNINNYCLPTITYKSEGFNPFLHIFYCTLYGALSHKIFSVLGGKKY